MYKQGELYEQFLKICQDANDDLNRDPYYRKSADTSGFGGWSSTVASVPSRSERTQQLERLVRFLGGVASEIDTLCRKAIQEEERSRKNLETAKGK